MVIISKISKDLMPLKKKSMLETVQLLLLLVNYSP